MEKMESTEEWEALLSSSSNGDELTMKLIRNGLAKGFKSQKAAGDAGLYSRFLPYHFTESVSNDSFSSLPWQIFANSVAGNSPLQNEAWAFLMDNEDFFLPVPMNPAQCTALEIALWSLIRVDDQRLFELCHSKSGIRLLSIIFDFDSHPDWLREDVMFNIAERILKSDSPNVLVNVASKIGPKSIYFLIDCMSHKIKLKETATGFYVILDVLSCVGRQFASVLEECFTKEISSAGLDHINHFSEIVMLGVDLLYRDYVSYDTTISLKNDDSSSLGDMEFETSQPSSSISEIIHLLAVLDKRIPKKTLVEKTYASSMELQELYNAVVGVKRECVRFIAFICSKFSTAPDLVRHFNGVALIISQANYDDWNPYIREISVLCTRLLLQNNIENQKIIGGLTPITTTYSDALEEAGFTSYINDKGKVVLQPKTAKNSH